MKKKLNPKNQTQKPIDCVACKNLFFMFFLYPRTIKSKTRAQSNPEQCKISYKIPILHHTSRI